MFSSLMNYAKGAAQPEEEEIRVEKLLIHPIKSARGISVDSAEYDQHGFKLDRRWLIIDSRTNCFLTCRKISKMILIEPSIQGENLIIKIPNDPPEEFSTPLFPSQAELDDLELVEDITLFSDTVDGYAVSSEIDEALSVYLGTGVRLVVKGPKIRLAGPHEPDGPLEYPAELAGTNYHDQYPILIASLASLKEAQEACRSSIEGTAYPIKDLEATSSDVNFAIERWRPNIVVSGIKEGFGEDAWVQVDVGGEELYCVARCGRCSVPNIHPETGVRMASLPWSTMQQFRIKHEGMPYCFGINAVPKSASGVIRVGDTIKVLQATDPETREIVTTRKLKA